MVVGGDRWLNDLMRVIDSWLLIVGSWKVIVGCGCLAEGED